MSYYALIIMAQAHEFIGDIEKAMEHYQLAEAFCPKRNEHLMYQALMLEKIGRYEEVIEICDKMLQSHRLNPFPSLGFLIEDRAYYDTSNFINEFKNRVVKRVEEPLINMDSVNFDFN
jgi:tetratricopeptide (TPR) repeat protein